MKTNEVLQSRWIVGTLGRFGIGGVTVFAAAGNAAGLAGSHPAEIFSPTTGRSACLRSTGIGGPAKSTDITLSVATC